VFFDATTYDLILPDILSNMVLYVPLGFCLGWILPRFVKHKATAAVWAMAIALLVSGAVEWAQAFLPSRVSSLIDLTANVAGTALGVCVALAARWTAPRFVGAALVELRHAPRIALTKAYVFLLFVLAAVPFTFTFDATRLYRSVRTAHLIPFASLSAASPSDSAGDLAYAEARLHAVASQPGVPNDPRGRAAFRAWQRDRHWSRWGAEAVSFLLLGLLVGVVLREDFGFSWRAGAALTAWVCGGVAMLLSIVHLFIVSRSFDTTDILFRTVGGGAAIGVLTLCYARETNLERVAAHRKRFLVRAAFAATLAFVLYNGLIPFRWDGTGERLLRSLSATSFLPFMSYNVARFDVALADLSEKLISWALLAGLAAASLREPAISKGGTRATKVAITTWCIGLSLLIETVQLFSPVRTASLTDPIIAGVGGVIGVALYTRLMAFYGLATTHDIVDRAARPVPPIQPILEPTDALIATLTEQRDDAPVEHMPTPRTVPRR